MLSVKEPTQEGQKIIDILILYLYTFSLYENASLIIFSAETELITILFVSSVRPLNRFQTFKQFT
jgi:hypothetical protein